MSGPRVLIVRFSAIGDCVMAAWAATAIKRALPESHIVWATQDTCAEVIDGEWLADEKVVADRLAWRKLRWSPALWMRQLKLFSSLRREGFDYGFDFQGHSKTALCLRLAKPKTRLSHISTDAFAAKLNQQVEVGRGSVHEVEAHHRLVSTQIPLGEERDVRMPEFPRLVEGNPVTIQTGASRAVKRYPVGKWKQVARRLVARGIPVVAVGGKHDPHLDVPGVQDLVGKLTLGQAMGVVQASSVHLAGDTGTGHVAAAYGVPVVSLFGQTEPDRYRPYGAETRVLQGPTPADIPVDAVVEATLSRLRSLCAS